MKTILRHIMAYAITCLLIFPSYANELSPTRKHELADSLWNVLSQTPSTADSITILNDIFDLSSRSKRDSIGRIIVNLSLRTGNSTVGLDAVRNLANINIKNDSLLNLDMELANLFPDSDDRDETMAFIGMMKNMYAVKYSTPEQKEAQIHLLLRQANLGNTNNRYEDLVMLHALSLYIGEAFQGELLSKYLDRMGSIIEHLRPEAIALRNCYYVQAAMSYANNEEYRKSIEADSRLLDGIQDLETGKYGMRRKYRTYDANRYITYTRLLSNYPLLSADEIDHFYKNAMNMVAKDSTASVTNRISLRPQIYYSMYHKDYAAALQLLKKAVDFPYNTPIRRQLLKLLIIAAEAEGDHDTLLQASQEYNQMLEDTLEKRHEEKYKELQMIYDINLMRSEHNRESAIMQRRFTSVAVGASIALFILTIIILWLWITSRRKVQKLSSENDLLQTERNSLMQTQSELINSREEAQSEIQLKNDLIQNMSSELTAPLHIISEYSNLIVDCSEANDKPYLRHFADLVNLNSELLKTTVNDVVDLTDIDSDKVLITLKREQILPLCKIAVDSIRHRVSPGVVVSLEPNLPDISINTDSHRLTRIIMQLLSNAAKFTTEGTITLGYTVNQPDNTISISVTDTGVGIKPEYVERIFQRFFKINKSSEGIGIGLPLSRYFAKLLGGTLIVDQSYTNGARVVLTIPID